MIKFLFWDTVIMLELSLNTDLEKFNSLSFESLMESRANSIAESSSTMTLSEKVEQLSEAECQQRIKKHQEKANKLLEAAKRVRMCYKGTVHVGMYVLQGNHSCRWFIPCILCMSWI